MLQRKKPLTRKTALRNKAPLKAKAPMRTKPARAATVTSRADEAAQTLWPLLQERAGPPFTMRERVGPYWADFACPAARLVILIENADDPARHDWFETQNWRVLAFAADDIAHTPERVLDAIAAVFSLRIVKH